MFANPLKILKSFGLKEGEIVADLGAGTGAYSILAAKMVSSGKVYAVEVVEDFIQTIINRLKDEKIYNVDCFLGDVEKLGGTKIKDSVVDSVIASNILFQVEDKEGFIKETKRILKPGGRVLLIDWESEGGLVVGGRAVPKDTALNMFQAEGFVLGKDVEGGAHHYGMIFVKK